MGDRSQPWHSATELHYQCAGNEDQLPEIKIGRNKREGRQNITTDKTDGGNHTLTEKA